jgi:hypothetical protein
MQDINCRISGRLSLAVPHVSVSDWHGLLRRGVGVFLDKAVSVRDFMTDVLGMDVDYATNSVPGLFLNCAPVDDWREERVGDGDEVGMSGTMPGLCGIALRRSSPIRAFRPDLVSHHGAEECKGGVARVKMFNFVARDCFPAVFRKGVLVSGESLLRYLDDQGITLDRCRCTWNGAVVAPGKLRELLAGSAGDLELRMSEVDG